LLKKQPARVKSMAPYKEGAYSAATHGLYDSTPKKEKRKKEMIMRYSSWGSISSSAQLVLFDSVVALLRTSEEKEITIRRKSTKPYVKLVFFFFFFFFFYVYIKIERKFKIVTFFLLSIILTD
jgi:hypothetical protein